MKHSRCRDSRGILLRMCCLGLKKNGIRGRACMRGLWNPGRCFCVLVCTLDMLQQFDQWIANTSILDPLAPTRFPLMDKLYQKLHQNGKETESQNIVNLRDINVKKKYYLEVQLFQRGCAVVLQ